jgi:hypothetical protein
VRGGRASWVPAWCWSLRYETAESAAVAGNDHVEPVDEHRASDRTQCVSHESREPDLGEERHAGSRVSGNGRPVAKDEPPAVVALVFRDGGQESHCFVVGEWEQTQLFGPVDLGDDTRRPPAELSGTGVEKNRARKPSCRRIRREHGVGHGPTLSIDKQIFKY